MSAAVSSKGQVTIPKEVRAALGLVPGASRVAFRRAEDGFRLERVPAPAGPRAVLGCLRKELAGRSVAELLNELRGPVDIPAKARRRAKQRKSK